MYCKYCGKEINDNSDYCSYCGKKLTIIRDGRINLENGEQNKNKRKNNKLLISAVSVFFVACLLAVDILGNYNLVHRTVSGFQKPKAVVTDNNLYVPDEGSIDTDAKTGISFVNNIILVFFEPGTSQDEVAATVSSIDGEIVGKIASIDQYQIRIEKSSLEELEKICGELKKRESVLFADYDQAVLLDENVIPNDPWKGNWLSPQRWSDDNPDGENWWLDAVDATEAWEYNDYFSNIKVGVVDTGFDIGHEDLKNVIVSASAYNDTQKHGTHVAGIIGAEANNKKGITGLVWNCELLTYDWDLNPEQKKEFKEENLYYIVTSRVNGGVVNLIEQGAKVINLSAGVSSGISESKLTDEELHKQGNNSSMYLHSLLLHGYDFLIVQSSGNGNKDGESIGAENNGLFCSINKENCVTGKGITAADIINRIIVVGSAVNNHNHEYVQAADSNAGDRVDICAPGDNVYSTIPGGWFGRYGFSSGTSMAAPVVTGISSLVWSVNPSLNGKQVKRIVCSKDNTKYDVHDNDSLSHPLVNTYRLVNAELAVKAAIASLDQKNPDQDEIYAAYRSLLKEYEEKYGSLWFEGSDEPTDLPFFLSGRGVCYARLIDFDQDGIEEFAFVYYDPANNYGEALTPWCMEVWGFYEGNLTCMLKDEIYSEGIDGVRACIAEEDDHFNIYCSYYGTKEYTLKDGRFVNLRSKDDKKEWKYANTSGVPKSSEETVYFDRLAGYKSDTKHILQDIVEETKQKLGYTEPIIILEKPEPEENKETISPSQCAQVKVNKLNIRKAPSKESEKVGYLTKGAVYSVTNSKSAEGYTWYQIGYEMWIADKDGEYLTIMNHDEAKVTAAVFEKNICDIKVGETLDVRVKVINGGPTDDFYVTSSANGIVDAKIQPGYEGVFETGSIGYNTVRIKGLKAGTTTVMYVFWGDVVASMIVNVK